VCINGKKHPPCLLGFGFGEVIHGNLVFVAVLSLALALALVTLGVVVVGELELRQLGARGGSRWGPLLLYQSRSSSGGRGGLPCYNKVNQVT
jgi:hypothetical protein